MIRIPFSGYEKIPRFKRYKFKKVFDLESVLRFQYFCQFKTFENTLLIRKPSDNWTITNSQTILAFVIGGKKELL